VVEILDVSNNLCLNNTVSNPKPHNIKINSLHFSLFFISFNSFNCLALLILFFSKISYIKHYRYNMHLHVLSLDFYVFTGISNSMFSLITCVASYHLNLISNIDYTKNTNY